jgi:hypothetical protein
MSDSGFAATRFRQRRKYQHASIVDLEGAAADLYVYLVTEPAIELRGFGLQSTGVGPTTAEITGGAVPSVLSLDIQRYNVDAHLALEARVVASPGDRAELGTLSFPANAVAGTRATKNLNANAGLNLSPLSYPKAYQGDLIVLEHKTQGSGAGAQTARVWFEYMEHPVSFVDDSDIDGPVLAT